MEDNMAEERNVHLSFNLTAITTEQLEPEV
jgi:hypothetical protein